MKPLAEWKPETRCIWIELQRSHSSSVYRTAIRYFCPEWRHAPGTVNGGIAALCSTKQGGWISPPDKDRLQHEVRVLQVVVTLTLLFGV